MIRKATIADLDQVEQCFVDRLAHEQAHTAYTSWKLGVYPTRATAEQALSDGRLYVMEQDGDLCAGMIASPNQPDKFLSIPWKYPAQPEEVFVLHLLCVRPTWARRGVGQALVQFLIEEARQLHRQVIRLDTGLKNLPAQALYLKNGFEFVACRSSYLYFERKI